MKVLTQFEKKPLLFQNPRKIISCDNPESFSACFEEIEIALCSGFFVAGFFSYEAGYCFEETLHKDKQYDFPLVYLGVYDAPKRSNLVSKVKTSQSELNGLRLNITQKNYFKDIDTIRNYIAKGDVYQITYCIKLLAKFKGDPLALYERLLKEQPVPYPAYLETERFRILSLSPEMFIKKTGGFTSTKPMKGTWPRGTNLLSDFSRRVRFQFDKKNRAENVMIADLLRNDLGRIGLNVRAPRLFEVAGYRKLYQMTSTITAKLDKDLPIRELFASLFPSGSVTGAPKIRAMEIIRQLELEERKIYTGAIGYICPNRDLFFNIPIRTLLIEGENAEMGIGGGIVWDSTPGGEWSEGLLKARFVTDMARSSARLL